MSYKALYRTYRPQRFEDVIGQDVIVKTLQNALNTSKITHAYLFSGPRGIGKTTIARLFAKAINCAQGMSAEPCNECISCKEIMNGNSPDVIEIDAASNNGVDEIREIREKVKFLPGEAKYKIYIIDEVHMLTTSAFNALLKTLEEPPKHVIFILATTEPQKVLPTILSRCQRYDFKSLTVDEISKNLLNIVEKENVTISKEAIIALAESAEGGMRDALSYLDQAISLSDDNISVDDVNSVTGNLSYDKIIELASCFEKKNISSALTIINELLNMGKEVSKIVTSMLQFYRDVLLYNNVDITEYKKYIFEKEEFKNLANSIDEKKIYYYVDVLSDTQNKLRASTTPQIFLEVALIKMMSVSSNELDLIEKVKELQERIDNFKLPENSNFVEVDNSKVDSINEKVNKVINELGRLELPRLIEKVKELENNKNQEDSYQNISREISKLKEEVYLNKANFNAALNKRENENLQNGDANQKIKELESLLEKEKEITKEKIEDIITERINRARKEVSLDYEKVKHLVDEKVKTLPSVNKENSSSDLLDRINNIEEKMYKMMSGALANQPLPTRKNKNSINANQIVLFGDEMVSVDNIEKHAVKERFDFSEFEKDVPKKEERKEKEETLFTVMKEEIIEEENPIVFEKNIVPKVEEKQEKEEINVFGESKYDLSTPAEKSLNRSLEGLRLPEEKKENNVDVYSYSKYDLSTPAEKSLNQSIEKLTDEFNKPKSQLVITKKEEDIVSTTSGLFTGEKEALKKEFNSFKNHEIISKSEPKFTYSPEQDEFERFEIGVIERILNDSLKSDAKQDKARILNLWQKLAQNTPSERKGIAELLEEGSVTAVGNREIIIVYKDISLCSQVMKRKFRQVALKLLFDFLGTTYNYIAIPEKVWAEKRSEYISQYNIGTKNIRLQPISDAILKILMSEEEISPEEEMLENAKSLFGEDLIEYKE